MQHKTMQLFLNSQLQIMGVQNINKSLILEYVGAFKFLTLIIKNFFHELWS
jgi:hypothetical protein